MVNSRLALFLIMLTQLVGADLSQAQSPNVIGNWKVEISFSNGQNRSLRVEAQPSGKGSFLPLIPPQVGSSERSTAQWTQPDHDSVTFSGPVQFPLGNVGVERGTLVLKGKFGADGAISGEASFFALNQDSPNPTGKPSKAGSFRATRAMD